MSTRPSEKSLIEIRRALQSIKMRLDDLETQALDLMPTSGAGDGGGLLMEDGALEFGTETDDETRQEFLTMMEELKKLLWSLGGVDTGYVMTEEGSAGDPGFWDLLALTGVTVGGSGSGAAPSVPLVYEDGEYIYYTLGGYLEQIENRLVAGGL